MSEAYGRVLQLQLRHELNPLRGSRNNVHAKGKICFEEERKNNRGSGLLYDINFEDLCRNWLTVHFWNCNKRVFKVFN